MFSRSGNGSTSDRRTMAVRRTPGAGLTPQNAVPSPSGATDGDRVDDVPREPMSTEVERLEAQPETTAAHWRDAVGALHELNRRIRDAVLRFDEGRLDQPL